MVGDEVLVFVLFFFGAAFVVVHPVVDFGDGGFYVVYGHFEDAVAKGCADALFVEGLSHFLDDFFDVVEVDFFCDGYEFVAAYAEDAVLAYDGAHGAGHFPECFIACFVAVGVVDVFEVIEVSADEGDGFALRDVLHKSHEAVPVHDSCELVGVPELSQAFVDVSVADEDAEESGDGCQEEGGVFQSVGCRVDDFDETEGFPVDGKVPGDEAVDFDGTDVAVFQGLVHSFRVVDDGNFAGDEALVEGFRLFARDFLEFVDGGRNAFLLPFIGSGDVFFIFFENHDFVGFEGFPDAFEHFVDAGVGISFVEGNGDHFIRCGFSDDFPVLLEVLAYVVFQAGREGEAVVLAAPRYEGVAHDVVLAGSCVVVDPLIEVVSGEAFVRAEFARALGAFEDFVAFLSCDVFILCQAQVVAEGFVEVDEVVCIGIAHGDSFVHVVELSPVEGDAVADVVGFAAFLEFLVIQTFHEEVQHAVEVLGLGAPCGRIAQVEGAVVSVDLGDFMDILGELDEVLVDGFGILSFDEAEEIAAFADMAECAFLYVEGIKRFLDAFQEFLPDLRAVHADGGIEVGHVEHDSAEVFSMEAVVVRILEACHHHAAEAEKSSVRIGEADLDLLLLAPESFVDVVEVAGEADDFIAVINREFRGSNGVQYAFDDAVADDVAFHASMTEDGPFVVLVRAFVDMPAHVFVRLAEDVFQLQAVVIEESVRSAFEAAVLVLPEELDAGEVEERLQGIVDENLAVLLVVVPCFISWHVAEGFEEFRHFLFSFAEAFHGGVSEAEEKVLGLGFIENDGVEFFPAVVAVFLLDAEDVVRFGPFRCLRDFIQSLGICILHKAFLIIPVDEAGRIARDELACIRDAVTCFQERINGLKDFEDARVHVDIVDPVVEEDGVSEDFVIPLRFLEFIVKCDVVEGQTADADLVRPGDDFHIDAQVLSIVDVGHRFFLHAVDSFVDEGPEFLVHRQVVGRQIGIGLTEVADADVFEDFLVGVVFVEDSHRFVIDGAEGDRRTGEDIDEAEFVVGKFFLTRFFAQVLVAAVDAEVIILHRTTVEVALDLFAADGAEEIHLFLRLGAFSERMDAEGFRHEDDGFDDFPALVIEIAQEGHIDLQFIEVEILQHIEGGVAASEVVHPALVARFPEAVDFALELLAVFDEGAFGDFYANITSGQAVLPDDSFDDVEGIDLIEVGAGQVDGNREDRHAGIFHRVQTFPDLLDDVGVQFVNELGIFKDRNEHVRRESASFGIFPAGERFHAAELPCQGADDRLIENLDVAVSQGAVEILQDVRAGSEVLPHRLGVRGPAPAGIALDGVAGDLGHIESTVGCIFGRIVRVAEEDAGLQCDAEIVDHFIDFAADGFYLLDDAVTRRNEGKIIGIQVSDDGVREMRAQYVRHLPEQFVALLNAVIGVVQFEVREVEIDRTVQSADPVDLFHLDVFIDTLVERSTPKEPCDIFRLTGRAAVLALHDIDGPDVPEPLLRRADQERISFIEMAFSRPVRELEVGIICLRLPLHSYDIFQRNIVGCFHHAPVRPSGQLLELLPVRALVVIQKLRVGKQNFLGIICLDQTNAPGEPVIIGMELFNRFLIQHPYSPP